MLGHIDSKEFRSSCKEESADQKRRSGNKDWIVDRKYVVGDVPPERVRQIRGSREIVH